MKISEIDWSVLRGALILLLVSVLVVAGALSGSFRFWAKHDLILKRANSTLSSTRGQFRSLDDEEDINATYLPRYAALEEQGVIGREQRLDWIDVLRQTARTVRLPKLEYTLEAQRPFDVGWDLGVGDYAVYASSMRLTLGLLHEGDLLSFFADLRKNTAGLFGVTACEMKRNGQTLSNQPLDSNVSAICELKFITIHGPETKAGVKS